MNLKKEIKMLNGESITYNGEILTVGKVVSEILVSSKLKGMHPVKVLELARNIYQGIDVKISDEELEQIKELVEKNENFIPLVIGQVLEAL